jgi:hypothetical protein
VFTKLNEPSANVRFFNYLSPIITTETENSKDETGKKPDERKAKTKNFQVIDNVKKDKKNQANSMRLA